MQINCYNDKMSLLRTYTSESITFDADNEYEQHADNERTTKLY
jgi:hypothetical protein